MARTVNDIVANAFYLLNEWNPENPLKSWMARQGVDLFNEICRTWQASGIDIPYYSSLNITLNAGQASYLFSKNCPVPPPPPPPTGHGIYTDSLGDSYSDGNGNLYVQAYDGQTIDPAFYVDSNHDKYTDENGVFYVTAFTPPAPPNNCIDSEKIISISTVNVYLNGISYPLNAISQSAYYDSVLVPYVASIPSVYELENSNISSKLTFYPVPYQEFKCLIRAKLAKTDALGTDEIDSSLPPHYQKFMKYALAKELSEYYETSNWTQSKQAELDKLEKAMKASNDIDLRIRDMAPQMIGGYYRVIGGI